MAVDFEWINGLESLPIYQCSAFTLGYGVDEFRPGYYEAGQHRKTILRIINDKSRHSPDNYGWLHNVFNSTYDKRATPPHEVVERSIYIHQCTLKGKIQYIRGNDVYTDIDEDFFNGQTFELSLHSFWYFCKRQNWKIPGWHPHNVNWIAEAQLNSAPASEQQNTLDPSDLPIELDAANMAYRAVLNGYGSEDDSFKQRLIDYLKTRHPNFTNDAVLRIATVANPDKTPGKKKRNP